MMQVVFYTRNQCQVCKEAKELLMILQNDYDFELVEKNIEASDKLTEEYGLIIPVIEVDEEIIQYGQIDYFTLNQFFHKKFNAS